MDKTLLLELIKKYVDGTATIDEETELLKWYQSVSDEEVIWASNDINEEEHVRLAMLNHINQHKLRSAPRYRWWIAAASVAIICAIGATFMLAPKHDVIAIHKKEQITPATTKATLTLADGTTLSLDSSKSGLLAKQGTISVNNSTGGQLTYEVPTAIDHHLAALTFNTIKTPRGGQYGLIMADGTKVWLNAASSLKFPTQFVGKERRVELTGEAYFEVAHHATRPFLVVANNSTIKVLGTHFNVSAYQDEAYTSTTLLQGSVRVNSGSNTALLKPGQVAVTTNSGSAIEVGKASADEALAWRSGYFIFNNESLKSICKKISRWYDVDFVFRGSTKDIYLVGNYSRNKNLLDLLQTIELGAQVKFELQERRVIVTVK